MLKCLSFPLDGEGGIVAEKSSLGSKTHSRYAILQNCHDGNNNILSETKGVITRSESVCLIHCMLFNTSHAEQND